MFLELLHNLLLYDTIIFDASSRVDTLSYRRRYPEVDEIMSAANDAGPSIIYAGEIAPKVQIDYVQGLICYILKRLDMTSNKRLELLSIPIPSYYVDKGHFDRKTFNRWAKEFDLDEDLVPLGLFMYRGIVYAGYANHYSEQRSSPTVYLASPGRMQALSHILSAENIYSMKYLKRSYKDLIKVLSLPKAGYDFSNLEFGDFDGISEFGVQLFSKQPEEALSVVLEHRNSHAGEVLRERWAERIWSSSRSCAVGRLGMAVHDATIHGNLNMTINVHQPMIRASAV
jgi:hypothetical protein